MYDRDNLFSLVFGCQPILIWRLDFFSPQWPPYGAHILQGLLMNQWINDECVAPAIPGLLIRQFKCEYEALQASATISVPQRWTNFCSMVGKNLWINFGTQSTLRHTAFRISNKIVVCNHSFSFRQLLVPKNDKILAFLTEVKKVSSTLA